MRNWMIIFFLGLCVSINAQQVISKGKVYEVNGKAIFHDGVDITSTLLLNEKDHIYKTLKSQKKGLRSAEKTREKLEKSANNSEKALKHKKKALDKFNKATKKLEQNQRKFDRLKFKGKLSPNDEANWLKKLEDYKKDVENSRRKM